MSIDDVIMEGDSHEKEKQYKEELFNLRFQQATGQLENTARLSKVRKNIARIKTILSEKALENN